MERLSKWTDNLWRFASDTDVPFTNNLAEQAMRRPTVKQKGSGCCRSFQSLIDFFVRGSYLDALFEQGMFLFESLVLVDGYDGFDLIFRSIFRFC